MSCQAVSVPSNLVMVTSKDPDFWSLGFNQSLMVSKSSYVGLRNSSPKPLTGALRKLVCIWVPLVPWLLLWPLALVSIELISFLIACKFTRDKGLSNDWLVTVVAPWLGSQLGPGVRSSFGLVGWFGTVLQYVLQPRRYRVVASGKWINLVNLSLVNAPLIN